MTTILVLVFGALGVLARHLIGKAMIASSLVFPWSTFVVNATGCLLIGILFSYASHPSHAWLGPELRAGLIVGFLGGFTTFSSFSLDTIRLLQGPEPWLGVVYAGGTLATGLIATWAGLRIGA